MKIERTKNASRNFIFGTVLKLYQIICPFIIRTAMIYVLGMEYVGLNSLFASILQVLNMTELGVGTAMVFSMYKPIAEDDTDTICKLMCLYKTYYRIIGVIIAVIGLAITPIVPKLIKDAHNVPLNIYYLYWLNLGYTVLSYWLFAYKNSILQAHQRTDLTSKVTLATNTFTYIIQFIIIIFTKNYYLYLIGMLFGQALTNVVTAIVADRMYPQYKAKGKLEKKEIKVINQRVRDLFTARIGGVIQNSADSIVISTFLGLTLLGRYNNYYFIQTSVFGFIIIIFNSCLAGVGNSLVLETPEKNYNDLKKISFFVEWITGFCSCCLICLYQPFIAIWAGEQNQLNMGIVICLSAYLYIITTNQLLCLYKDASGIWHSDRFRPLITALVNLTLNLLSIRSFGLYGVVLSTVMSMLLVGIPWLIHNLFSSVFKRSSYDYVKDLLLYFATAFVACIVTYFICSIFTTNSVLHLLIRLSICIVSFNVIYWFALHRKNEYNQVLILLNKILNGKLINIPIFRKYLKF